MTKLTWGTPIDAPYHVGVDRGVLYPTRDKGVAWNGLVTVEEHTNVVAPTPVYFDGVKTFDRPVPREFTAMVTALTYPDEFMEFDGYEHLGHGFYVGEQLPSKTFSMSYRTLVGDGKHYKIHILYNLSATPSSAAMSSLTATPTPTQFIWKVSGVPERIERFSHVRPSCYAVLDTRLMSPNLKEILERTLYGTDTTEPRLPSMSDLVDLFINKQEQFVLKDIRGGKWTLLGPDGSIQVSDTGDFSVDGIRTEENADGTYTIFDDWEI